MRALVLIPFAATSLLLNGCVAKTLVDVATLPVRAAGKAVDLATTSQSEADEKRGRELRKREEEIGKLQRTYDKQLRECDRGDRGSCTKARETYAELTALMPSLPPPPDR